MASKLLMSLALVASCTATALPRAANEPTSKGYVKYPITRETRNRPLVRRDLDVPLYNVTAISYLIERKQETELPPPPSLFKPC